MYLTSSIFILFPLVALLSYLTIAVGSLVGERSFLWKNYYEELEVAKGASLKDIKKAKNKLARIHHPDKGGDGQRMMDINEAYDVLGDDAERKEYDEHYDICMSHEPGIRSKLYKFDVHKAHKVYNFGDCEIFTSIPIAELKEWTKLPFSEKFEYESKFFHACVSDSTAVPIMLNDLLNSAVENSADFIQHMVDFGMKIEDDYLDKNITPATDAQRDMISAFKRSLIEANKPGSHRACFDTLAQGAISSSDFIDLCSTYINDVDKKTFKTSVETLIFTQQSFSPSEKFTFLETLMENGFKSHTANAHGKTTRQSISNFIKNKAALDAILEMVENYEKYKSNKAVRKGKKASLEDSPDL